MDVIRTVRGKQLLKAQMQAMQQAGLHQAAARYQLVQAQLGAKPDSRVCPPDDPFLLLAGVLPRVIQHGVQLSGEHVLRQLSGLLCQINGWPGHYLAQSQPIRLLSLWLDKLLRLSTQAVLNEESRRNFLSLDAMELRCLGHLDAPWWQWSQGQASEAMELADDIGAALQLPLQAYVCERQFGKGLACLLDASSGEGVAVTEMAVLLYGALAIQPNATAAQLVNERAVFASDTGEGK